MIDASHSPSPRAVLRGTLTVCTIMLCAIPGYAQPAEEAANADGLGAALAIEQAFVSIIEKAEASVVSIARFQEPKIQPIRDPFNRRGFQNQAPQRPINDPTSPEFVPSEFGSGIIVTPDAKNGRSFILTNYHVVRGGPLAGANPIKSEYKLYVRLSNRLGYFASIIAADPRSDLALLDINYKAMQLKPTDLKPIPFGDAANIRKGKLVLALGNPYAIGRDGSASVSWGMVSNISRRPAPIGQEGDAESKKKETLHHYGTLLHVDTRLNLGTSGGALLNLQGKLIGITTALAALDGYEKSVGYAIPIDASTRRIIETLAKGREVEYGFLGVQLGDSRADEFRNFPPQIQQRSGARINDVTAESPAHLGGLRASDIVLKVNNEPVLDRYDLMLKVGSLPPESKVDLTVWQPGTRFDKSSILTITLGKWPVRDVEGIVATNPRYQPWRGMQVDYSTGRSKYLQYFYRRFPQGVLITRVESQSQADSAKLQAGEYISHVNQTPVKTPAEFYDAVRTTGAKTVSLRIIGRDTAVDLPN